MAIGFLIRYRYPLRHISGEIEFYVDKSAIFNKIPAKLRKAGCMGMCGAMFTLEGITPEFVIQISGRRIQVR